MEVSKHVPWQAGARRFKACSQASWGWKFQSMFPGKLGVEVSRGKEYINKARNLPIEKDCHMLKIMDKTMHQAQHKYSFQGSG